jgi:hypothetical protein
MGPGKGAEKFTRFPRTTRNTGISGTPTVFISSNLPKYGETVFLSNNINDSLNNNNLPPTKTLYSVTTVSTLQAIVVLVLKVVSGCKRGRS